MMIYHKSPTKPDRIATAPYNFVRLPEKILQPPEDENDELNQSAYSGLNGYFDITIETSSPLYTRGMMTPEQYAVLGKKKNLTSEEKEELSPFFTVNSRPRLPGSSLRGMFRTMVEILSYSKLYEITDEHYMYRSVDTSRHGETYRHHLFNEPVEHELYPRYQAGYMHREGAEWYIRPAIEVKGATYARVSHEKLKEAKIRWSTDHLSEGDNPIYYLPVFIKPSEVKLHIVRGFIRINFMKVESISIEEKMDQQITQKATLVVSGYMKSKKSEALVFPLDETKLIPENWIKIPRELENIYKKNGIPNFGNNEQTDSQGVLKNGHPIFYLLDESMNIVSFGHCPMMRIPYINSPLSLLPDELRQTSWWDLAERIFGCVKKKDDQSTEAIASRVFFEDAILAENTEPRFENNGNSLSPKILSTPKPTTFQHYLIQTDPDDKKKLLDYNDNTLLRGHKLYWAHNKAPKYIQNDDEELKNHESQYTRIKPLSKDNLFHFRLRFENLTPIELGALGFVIRIGEDEKLRLRIGMGKPYGLGAIRFSDVKLTMIDRQARYRQLFKDSGASEYTWHLGVIPEEDAQKKLQEAREAFEGWVLSDTEVNPDSKKSLVELERIRELLRLLNWPGPLPENNKYEELDNFRDCKVLPTPLVIPTQSPPMNIVTAIISDASTNVVECLIKDQEKAFGKIDKKRFARFTYQDGERYTCEVLSESKDPNGEILYILRPLRKVR